MAILSKEALLEASVPTEEVELPSKGGSVLVRALTRGQVHANSEAREKGKKSNKDIEAQTLVWGMIEPQLDVNEVKAWMDAAGTDEVNRVVTAIMNLSGFDEEDQKRAAAQFREEG